MLVFLCLFTCAIFIFVTKKDLTPLVSSCWSFVQAIYFYHDGSGMKHSDLFSRNVSIHGAASLSFSFVSPQQSKQ